MFPLSDHFRALQVYLDVGGVEDHPLELPPGPGHISVDLCLVQEPLQGSHYEEGEEGQGSAHLETVEVVVSRREGEVTEHVHGLTQDGELWQPHRHSLGFLA